MPRRQRVSGYRSAGGGGGGCLSGVIWLGVLVNIGVIVYIVGGGNLRALTALWDLPAETTSVALRAFNQGDLDTAITQAQAALAADPQNTAAAMTLTRALIYRSYTDFDRAADLPAALNTSEAVLENNPTDPDALAAYAFALQANGQPVTAVETAEQALEQDPAHTLARTALALGYAQVGSFEIALRESQAALANDTGSPARFDARRAEAISMADLGNYAEAGALLDELIADYRQMIPLYYERALYARQVSDAATAEEAYFSVLAQDEANIKAQLRLCEFFNSIAERDTARTHCEQVTQQAPDLAQGWYQLGRLHFLAGEFEQAQATLNRCSTLQMAQNTPTDERIFECWYLQGQAAEILGNCEDLLRVYNQFQALATDSRVRETWTYPPEGPPMCQ